VLTIRLTTKVRQHGSRDMAGTDPSSHTDLESTVLPSLLRYGLDALDTLGHGRSNGDQKSKPYGPEAHSVAEFA
jgi:hypothetical protein